MSEHRHRIGEIDAILQGKDTRRRRPGRSTRARGACSRKSGGELQARIGQLAGGHRACRVLHAGSAGGLRRARFRPARPTCGSRSGATPTRWASWSREGSCGSCRGAGRHRSRSGESGRRQLADWIASGDNPLTARVAVNRIWQRLFGEGIVRSVDYFGRRGEAPDAPRAARCAGAAVRRGRLVAEAT